MKVVIHHPPVAGLPPSFRWLDAAISPCFVAVSKTPPGAKMEETFTIQLQEDGRRLKDLAPIGWGFVGFLVGLVEDCKKGLWIWWVGFWWVWWFQLSKFWI